MEQTKDFWNELSCHDVTSWQIDRIVLYWEGRVGQGSAWRLCKIRWHAWGRAGGKSQARQGCELSKLGTLSQEKRAVEHRRPCRRRDAAIVVVVEEKRGAVGRLAGNKLSGTE